MEITLLQGILLTIMTIIVGLDFFLEAFFIFRPLIVSTLTGLILGDITLGLKVGALIELAFAGLTPAGGTQPPNPVFAGLMGTVLRIQPAVIQKLLWVFVCHSLSWDSMSFCSIIPLSHSLWEKPTSVLQRLM